MPDWWELAYFGNTNQVANGDSDNDGLNNLAEYNAQTAPNVADTDGDGMKDGFEAGTSGYQVVLGSFTWDVARAHAMAKGGHLATITSAAEKTAIATQVTQAEMNELWLGGYQSSGTWKWVTGEPWDYTNWNEGVPSNDPTQDYLRLESFANGWDNWFSTPTYGSLPVTIRGYLLEKTGSTDPAKYNYPLITAAFSFQNFTAAPTNNPSNLMTAVTGDQFGRELLVNFPQKFPTFSYKITAGSWDTNWGGGSGAQPAGSSPQTATLGGSDITGSIPALGYWRFYFNTDTRQYSLGRASFSDFASFAAAYGLPLTSQNDDGDQDGLTNEQEQLAQTHPMQSDTDDDGLSDGEEVNGDFSIYGKDTRSPIPTNQRSSALSADSDGDGLPDGWEVIHGLDPMDSGVIVSAYNNFTGLTVSANPNGANANPDGDSGGTPSVAFSNLDEFNGGSSPVDASSVPAFRSVTFAVDMRAQMLKGTFNRTNQGVELRGSFNEWAGGQALVESIATNGIYTNTFTVKGQANTTNAFKFYLTDTNVLANNAYEGGSDRSLVLGPSEQALTVPLALFGNEQARTVTFAVNMEVFRTLGRFNTNTDTVSVVGPAVGGWPADQRKGLTNDGTGIYSGSFVVSGDAGLTNAYKFLIGTSWYEDLGNEVTGTGTNAVTNQITRNLVLGANLTNQPAPDPAPFFNNESQVRMVTFAVNMNVQTNTNKLGFKMNGVDRVEVRYGPAFDGGLTLTNTNNSGIFLGTFPVSGNAGTEKAFKYVAITASNTNFVTTWERVDVPRTNEYANRSFTLGANGTPQTVHSEASPALFSGDDGIGPVITLTGANPLNLANGATWSDPGATAADAAEGTSTNISGSGTVDTITAGSYTITYSASDAAGNAGTAVTRTVIVAAAPSGSTFASWRGANAATPELLTQYAFGAFSPSNAVNRSNLPTGGVNGSNLVLTYHVRADANNANLVVPQLSGNLTDTNSWNTNGITHSEVATNTVDGVSVVRKTASVPIDSTNRKFLRLKIAE